MFKKLKSFFSNDAKVNQFSSSTNFTIDDFAKEFSTVLEQLRPNGQYLYNHQTHTINDNEDKGFKIYLGNLFNKTKTMSLDERREHIEHFVNEAVNQNSINIDLLKEQMYYRLRTKEEISNREIYLQSSKNDFKQFLSGSVGDLNLELVIDQNTTVRTPTSEMLTELGLSEKDLFDLAHKNMIRVTRNDGWKQLGNNIWQSNYHDDYDGSRMVSLYPEIPLPFSGIPVAFMPSHSICLITEEKNTEALQSMIDIGNKLAIDHRSKTDDQSQVYFQCQS